MRYHRHILNTKVVLTGPTFWGWNSTVRLEPAPGNQGWWWKLPNGHMVPIDHTTLVRKHRRLVLQHEDCELNAPDHLLPLAAVVNGVCIVQESGWRNSWVPYGDGSGSIFWQAVRDHIVHPHVYDTPRAPTPGTEAQNGRKRVSFSHHPSRLEITVHIDYKGLGKYSETFVFPEDFPRIISTSSQGWPPRLYKVARLAGNLGWPHTNSIVWPQRHSTQEALECFARHRALDLLGVVAATTPPGRLVTGTYTSCYAGHKEDIELLRALAARGNVIGLFDRAA